MEYIDDEFYEGAETEKYFFNIWRLHHNLKETGVRWDYLIEVVHKENGLCVSEITHYLKDARKTQSQFMTHYKEK